MTAKYNKKGFLLEGIFILVILFAFIFAVFVGMKVWNEVNENLPDEISQEAKDISNEGAKSFEAFNSAFAFLFIGLIIVAGVSVFFIPSHPIFFVVSFLTLGIMILFGVIFGNIFDEGVVQSQLYNETLTFPLTTFGNLPLVLLIVGALLIIILFAKSRSGEAV